MDYAVTIKCNTKDAFMYQEDFKDIKDDIFPSDNVTIHTSSFELDKNGILHEHCHISALHPLNYKACMRKGWHIYIRQLKGNFKRWIDYIQKEPRSYESLLQERLNQWSKQHDMFPLCEIQ